MDARLEERYVVIKIKDLSYTQRVELDDFLQDNNIATVDCVVVEEDWPCYKNVVDMVLEDK